MSEINSKMLKIQEQRGNPVAITARSWQALNGVGMERVPCLSFLLLTHVTIYPLQKWPGS